MHDQNYDQQTFIANISLFYYGKLWRTSLVETLFWKVHAEKISDRVTKSLVLEFLDDRLRFVT